MTVSVFSSAEPIKPPAIIDPSSYKEAFLNLIKPYYITNSIFIDGEIKKGFISKEDFNLDVFQKAFIINSLKESEEASNSFYGFYCPVYLRQSNFIILGAGGVASWFVPQLIKILYTLLPSAKEERGGGWAYNIYIVDGDTVNL